jgi:hypothetical protein
MQEISGELVPLYGPDLHAVVMRALECNLLFSEVRCDSIANVTWSTFQKTGQHEQTLGASQTTAMRRAKELTSNFAKGRRGLRSLRGRAPCHCTSEY